MWWGELSGAGILQSFSPASQAESETEFRARLGMLGSLSLMTSEIALSKAANPKVKMFAKCEADEQKAIATVSHATITEHTEKSEMLLGELA